MYLGIKTWWGRFAEVQTEHQNEKKKEINLSDFGCGMVVSPTNWIYREWSEEEMSCSGSCVDENALLMSEDYGKTGLRFN